MPTEDRRARERAARRQLIVDTARQVAEAEGWDAVTTRRLSTEIEYSQPVLYKHFSGMDQVAAAVAIDGFADLRRALQTASAGATTPDDALARIARAYLDFARDNPAVYDAMFTARTTLRFAEPETPPELVAAFEGLRAAVSAIANKADDADTLTEVFWAALHGLVSLSRGGRLRPDHDRERVDALIARFCES
jgi:AcrR family transcriptional regulator